MRCFFFLKELQELVAALAGKTSLSPFFRVETRRLSPSSPSPACASAPSSGVTLASDAMERCAVPLRGLLRGCRTCSALLCVVVSLQSSPAKHSVVMLASAAAAAAFRKDGEEAVLASSRAAV